MSFPTIGELGWQEGAGTDECDDWIVAIVGNYDSLWLETNLDVLHHLIECRFGKDQSVGGLTEDGSLFLAIPPNDPNLLLFVEEKQKRWERGEHLDPDHYRDRADEEIQTRWDDGTLAERINWVRQAKLPLSYTKDETPDPQVAEAIEEWELE